MLERLTQVLSDKSMQHARMIYLTSDEAHCRISFVSQLVNGVAFPNALLQHALGDIEDLSIDVSHLRIAHGQRRDDRAGVAALRRCAPDSTEETGGGCVAKGTIE
jgi:hypothetical protein